MCAPVNSMKKRGTRDHRALGRGLHSRSHQNSTTTPRGALPAFTFYDEVQADVGPVAGSSALKLPTL